MKNVLSKTARQYGVSVSEVRAEIEKAIFEGMKSNDKSIGETWSMIPCKGKTPTAEELISWICCQIKKEDLL